SDWSRWLRPAIDRDSSNGYKCRPVRCRLGIPPLYYVEKSPSQDCAEEACHGASTQVCETFGGAHIDGNVLVVGAANLCPGRHRSDPGDGQGPVRRRGAWRQSDADQRRYQLLHIHHDRPGWWLYLYTGENRDVHRGCGVPGVPEGEPPARHRRRATAGGSGFYAAAGPGDPNG